MELLFLGTGAAQGYPAIFCRCENCEAARQRGGRSIRRRSALLVNDDLLLDFGPDVMAAATRRAGALERAVVDGAEAVVLAPRVGERFPAVVVEAGGKGGVVQLREPAVRARCEGADLPLGERLDVQLVTADPATRTVLFRPA